MIYLEKFNKNNNDKESAVRLAEGYSHIMDYDNATDVLTKYLNTVKEGEALDVRFTMAKLLAENLKMDLAFNQMTILLKYSPENKEYRLFEDLLVGLVNSTPEEIDPAIKDLKKILKEDPKNLTGLLAMVYLNTRISNFSEADHYFSLAKIVAPNNSEVIGCEHFLNGWRLQESEKELNRKRGEVAKLTDNGDFQGAETKYDEIMSKLDNPEKNLLLEYASVKINVKKYDDAISIYNNILNKEYDQDVDVDRAKLYYYKGDSTRSLEEFSRLAEKNPNDFDINLYLTDSYLQIHEFKKARNVLHEIDTHIKDTTMVLDSVQTTALNLRYHWLPETGWARLVSGFGRIAIITKLCLLQ